MRREGFTCFALEIGGGGVVGERERAEGGGDGESGEEARGAEEPAEGRGGWGDEGLLRAEEAEEGWTAA